MRNNSIPSLVSSNQPSSAYPRAPQEYFICLTFGCGRKPMHETYYNIKRSNLLVFLIIFPNILLGCILLHFVSQCSWEMPWSILQLCVLNKCTLQYSVLLPTFSISLSSLLNLHGKCAFFEHVDTATLRCISNQWSSSMLENVSDISQLF